MITIFKKLNLNLKMSNNFSTSLKNSYEKLKKYLYVIKYPAIMSNQQ